MSMWSTPVTRRANEATDAASSVGAYVIQTAPCSNEWTAFSSRSARGYTTPVQVAHTAS